VAIPEGNSYVQGKSLFSLNMSSKRLSVVELDDHGLETEDGTAWARQVDDLLTHGQKSMLLALTAMMQYTSACIDV